MQTPWVGSCLYHLIVSLLGQVTCVVFSLPIYEMGAGELITSQSISMTCAWSLANIQKNGCSHSVWSKPPWMNAAGWPKHLQLQSPKMSSLMLTSLVLGSPVSWACFLFPNSIFLRPLLALPCGRDGTCRWPFQDCFSLWCSWVVGCGWSTSGAAIK